MKSKFLRWNMTREVVPFGIITDEQADKICRSIWNGRLEQVPEEAAQ